jgi:hypothetical protein
VGQLLQLQQIYVLHLLVLIQVVQSDIQHHLQAWLGLSRHMEEFQDGAQLHLHLH